MARSNAKTSNCFKAATRMSDADVRKLDAAADVYGTGDITADYRSAASDMLASLQAQRSAIQAAIDAQAKPAVVEAPKATAVNADVLGPDQATANAVNKDMVEGKADLPANADVVQSSKAPKSEGSDAAAVTAELKGFMRLGALGNKVTVVQTVADLPAGIQRSVNPTADTQGFVVNGKAYLVAGNIAPGKPRSVFLHEVGAHLGLENLLGKDNYAALVAKVQQWAAKNDGSQESKLAQAAQQRVTGAGTEASQADSELVAYFIEEAVDAGIDPTATQANSEFGRWFRTLWAAFKTAMHTLGVNPDKLTAQNVVDMAYGAAKLEATGTFHGTAGEFRKFDHKYMGSGEGAQAFGWGSYFAQAPGIAKGYFKTDVSNKTPKDTTLHFEGRAYTLDQLKTEHRAAVNENRFADAAKFLLLRSIARQGLDATKADVAVSVARHADNPDYDVFDKQKAWLDANGAKVSVAKPDAPEGSLMRVDFNVADDEWLDLDKPMREQAKNLLRVASYMPRSLQDALVEETNTEIDEMTGRDLYFGLKFLEDRDSLVGELFDTADYNARFSNGAADKVVSAYLDEQLGIKGNKFLDANSRGTHGAKLFIDGQETYAMSSMSFGEKDGIVRLLRTNGDVKTALREAEAEELGTPEEVSYLKSLVGKEVRVDRPAKTSNFVVFNDKNIQRVSSMKAADRNRVSFSKAKPQTMQQFSDKLPGRVADLWDSFKTLTDEISVKAMFTQDLVNMASKVMPSAAKYLSAMGAIQIERGKAERVVADVVEDFRALPAHERGMGVNSVNAFLKESTMTGKWAFAPEWLPGKAADPVFEAKFKASLSPKAQELVKRVFKRGFDALVEMQNAAVANADSEYNVLIAEATKAGNTAEVAKLTKEKAKSLKDFQGLLAIHKGSPYAPLKRFGNYTVIAVSQEYKAASEAGDHVKTQEMQRDGAHYHIEFVDTNWEARTRTRVLEPKFPGGYVGKMEKSDEGLMMGGRDMLGAFGRLRKSMSDSVSDNPDVDKATSKRIDDMMRQLYLTLLSESSARKGEIHRKNVAGANDDMMRSFATQGRATAHFIASLKTSGKVDDHLAGMRSETRALNSGREERTRYYNEIIRRHSLGMEYKPTPFIDQAMAGTSAMMLLTNPSYHLMNALQPGMMTLPMLAGRHGYVKSLTALTRAYRELAPILKAREFTEKSYAALPQDVRQAIEDLANRGKIDIMMDADLGRVESASDNKIKQPFVVASEWLKNISQDVESMNRLSSAIAAYRLEIGQPKATHQSAVDYAASVIYETHGDYSGFNAPRFMRSGLGRLTTQFKKFQLIQLSMFVRLAHRSMHGMTAEERTTARYAMGYNLAHLFAMGGVMGMPGFAAIAWAMGKLFGDDEPDDPEATLRRAIGNEALADFLLQGVPASAGVNVSGRIGAGGMLSVLPYTDLTVSRKSYPEILMAAMGPFIGGVVPRAVGGVELMAKGELAKGVEAVLPNGMGNALKSYRFGTDGVSKGNGDTLMSAEDINTLDIIGQAFGLPTTKITDRVTESASQYKAEQFYKDRTSELKQRYTKAVKANDSDALGELRAEWTNTQAARKALGFQPSPLGDLLKAPAEQRKREAATARGVQFNKGNQGFVEAIN